MIGGLIPRLLESGIEVNFTHFNMHDYVHG